MLRKTANGMAFLFTAVFLAQTAAAATPTEGKNYFVNGNFSAANPAENWLPHHVFSITNEESSTPGGHSLKITGPEQWHRLDYKIETEPQNGVPIDPAPDVVYTFSFKHKGVKNGRFDFLAMKWLGDLYVEEDADWKEYSVDIPTHSREYFYFQLISCEPIDGASYFDDFRLTVKLESVGVLEPKPTGVMRTTEGKYYDIPVGTNLWNMGWGGDKAFKEGVDWATAYDQPNHGDIWRPVFLEELKPYSLIRFADWCGVNLVNDNVYGAVEPFQWDKQRRKPTDDHGDLGLVAYEWMIDLCNKTGKDIWINVPDLADDEYMENLAKLLKEKLNPERKVYLEWSLEVWNWGYPQAHRALKRGQELGYANPNAMDYVERSFNLFRIFEKVYGKSEMEKRVRRICAFSGDLGAFADGYGKVIDDPKINIHAQKADYMAVAPYVGHDFDGYDYNRIAKFHRRVDELIPDYIEPAYNIARKFGCPLITYEGGQHITRGAAELSRDQELYHEYLYMLNRFSRYFESFTHYNHCGAWGDGGAWGALEYTGQDPADAPKYRALRDWIETPVIPDPGEKIPVGQPVNPHFQHGMEGWAVTFTPGAFEVVSEEGSDKDHCLKIRNFNSENCHGKMASQKVKLEPGRNYALCYDKKIEAKRYDACTVKVFDPNTNHLLNEVRFSDHFEWQRVASVFTPPADGNGVIEIRITPNGYTGDSTTWLGNFVITEVPEDYEGWMGVPPDESQITGDPEFIQIALPPLPTIGVNR